MTGRVELGGGYALIFRGGVWLPVFGQGALITDRQNAEAFAQRFTHTGSLPYAVKAVLAEAETSAGDQSWVDHFGLCLAQALARLRTMLRVEVREEPPNAGLLHTLRQLIVTYRREDYELKPDVFDQLIDRLDKMLYGEPTSRFRHRARGSTYAELGRAELQISGEWELEEGDTIVVYQCEQTGKLWAREKSEMEDGRFEEIT